GQPNNWDLKKLLNSENLLSDDPLAENLRIISNEHGITKIYAPKATHCNAIICEPKDLEQEIVLSDTLSVYRGFDADGVVIPKGSAMFTSSADCPTIAVYDKENETLVGAHA